MVNSIAEAIACRLIGHTICSMCGDCVECSLVVGINIESPGHMAHDKEHNKYRCNNTYMKLTKGGTELAHNADQVSEWWTR